MSNPAADVIRGIRKNPAEFCEAVLGFHCWSKQRQIIESVRDNRRTAVRSGHGSGKTAIAARTVLWFLAAYPHSVVVTTAPTWIQVEKQLWREIAKGYEQAQGFYDGDLFKTDLQLGPDWFATGISTNTPERFSGFHSAHILLVVDEASGVEDAIFEAGEGFLTSEDARILLIGNPTQLAGQFHRAFHREASIWNRIHVSTADTPAYTGEKVPEDVLQRLPHADWAAQMERKFGKESALYAVRVLGEFASSQDDAVCKLGEVEKAQQRELDPSEPVVISCDVARMGGDETVIALRRGGCVRILEAYSGKDLMETAGRVAKAARKIYEDFQANLHVVVDEAGLGGGVSDRLREFCPFPVHGFNSSQRAKDPKEFPNRRSEAWFEFSERLGEGTVDLDADEQLLEDLVAPVFKIDSQGRRVVEPKDETRKRLGRSPDRADAVLMAFAFNPSDPLPSQDDFMVDRRAFSAGVLTRQF